MRQRLGIHVRLFALVTVAAVVALAPTAVLVGAQDVSPELVALPAAGSPFELGGGIQRSSQHGCSQSFASSSDNARLRLVVDARGGATLTLDLERHEVFGPSPGRYADGDHDITHTTELARATFTGQASRTRNGVDIELTRLASANVRFTGYGTLPLPAPTVTRASATLRCQLARIDVLPTQAAEAERPTAMSLVECRFDSAPTIFERLIESSPSFVLGRGAGVRVFAEQTMWDQQVTRLIRREP
jgi:hypothetical protein